MGKHLDTANSYARVLFIDYSSAFNTIIPSLLIDKLKILSVHPTLIAIIQAFLTNRTQVVSVNGCQSSRSITNTGSPQGCVLSPLLFTLYTDGLRSQHENVHIIKYADDTAVVGLLKHGGDDSAYFSTISSLVSWCNAHNLLLNASKTKEMQVNFSRTKSIVTPVVIKDECIEQVSHFKYLGVHFNNSLKWNKHADSVNTKLRQRLYCFYHYCSFSPTPEQRMSYIKSLLLPLIMYNCELWFLACDRKSIAYAQRFFSKHGINLDDIVRQRTSLYQSAIIADLTHPLRDLYTVLPRTLKYRSLKCRTSRFLDSFVPCSIRLFNSY